MSRRRIKFSKLNMGKFISHLDLLRAFTRAITRAELPVKYSNGFNPHQLITFSLPLSVGVTSETEYTDIDFEDTVSNNEIMERLNETLPPDLRVLSVTMPQISANDICAAEYIVTFQNFDFKKEKIEEFFLEEEIPVVKKTKKGEKVVNLKDYIKGYEILSQNEDKTGLKIVLSAGGQENIKPAILTNKLIEYVNAGDDVITLIHRKEIFYRKGKEILKFC